MQSSVGKGGQEMVDLKMSIEDSGVLCFCAESEERNELSWRRITEGLGHTAGDEPAWARLVG